MEILIIIFYCFLFWYLLNIFWLIIGFNKIKDFDIKNTIPTTKFSIIVPFRNEAQNLPKLLTSFEKLNYPLDLFEVILVDDESTDNYELKIKNYELQVVSNLRKSNSPKKDAINTAITIAKNDWIITTDADCVVPNNWLLSFDAFIQSSKARMIASGVMYDSKDRFLDNFQQLDLLSLQGTTIGSFGNQQAFMCNGANFCYEKSYFYELKGFEGNENIASGDDVFLLQKAISKYPETVYLLKSSATIVTTKPEESWKNLFFQRVRWASKTDSYNNFYSKQLGLTVFTANLLLVTSYFTIAILLIITNFSSNINSIILILLPALLKFITDYILIKKTSAAFNNKLKNYCISSFFYPFFCVAVVVYSIVGKYTWKGRKFRK